MQIILIHNIIENELNKFIINNNLNGKLDNFNFKLKYDVHINSINYQLNNILNIMKQSLLSMNYNLYILDINTYLKDRGDYYVSEVWSGVPSLGWGYVKQHFRANISGSKINSIEMLGSSYQDGFIIDLGQKLEALKDMLKFI